MKKLTIAVIRERTKHCGAELVSTKYRDTMEPLVWRCQKCNTVYDASYKRMYRPINRKPVNMCPNCGIRRSQKKTTLTIDIIRDRIKERGLTCMSDEFQNSFVKMQWQCTKCNSVFWAPYNRIQKSIKVYGTNGCKKCQRAHGGDYSRLNEKEINKKLKKDGRDVRIEKYSGNITSKSTFFDSRGHKWEAKAENVLYGRKNGCPICQRTNHRTKEWQIIKKLREGGTGVVLVCYSGTASSKSEFACKNGHSFFAKATNVLCRRSGCRQCVNKSEEKILSLMAKEFSIDKKSIKRHCMLRPYHRFADFLLEHKERKIWIEYDGEQHFKPIEPWGGQDGLDRQQALDAKDPQIADELGYELHRIRYDENKHEAIKRILQ